MGFWNSRLCTFVDEEPHQFTRRSLPLHFKRRARVGGSTKAVASTAPTVKKSL
jgi:hypothetical protein